MSTTITGKLNKAAREFQAGAYTGFGIRLGKQYYDRETKQKEWTNYEAAVFTDKPQQIEFYRSSLVEGSVVEVMAEAEKIKQFQGDSDLVLTIELIDCKLGLVHTGQPSGSPAQQAPQMAPQAAPQQAPSQLGYWYDNGEPMTPEHVSIYTKVGHGPWAKGQLPPQL